MRSFIFLCDMSTEQECLERMLFGTNAGENLKHHYAKLAVGDRLFLYNFETGLLRGPFAALTTCTYNLEPNAWRKARRTFLWQVRVDGTSASKTPLRADNFVSFIPLTQMKIGLLPPAELTEHQSERLLALFAQGSSRI